MEEIKKNILKNLFLKPTKVNNFKEENYICPSYINNENPKYIEIDNMYYSGIMIVNYLRENEELLLKSLINTDININIRPLKKVEFLRGAILLIFKRLLLYL